MAVYTITLAELVRAKYPIFDDSWTTFIPEHKAELCAKILRHYHFYEIGSETADRFKYNLNEHLALIMPYYNKMYETELWNLEPFYNQIMEISTTTDTGRNKNRGLANRRDINSLREIVESIKKLSEGTSNLIGNEKLVGNEKWNEDRTIHTSDVTDQDTTEKTTQKVEFTENVVDAKKEVVEDTVDGTKTTDGTSHTNTSNTRRYSDTPQARINAAQMTIEQQYLTNYTSENGTSDTTTHSDEVIKNIENKTTDTTDTKDTTSTQDTTKNVIGTNDITKTVNTTDNVVGNKDKTQNTDETEDIKTTSKEHDFSNGTTRDRSSHTEYTDEKEAENEKKISTNIVKGSTESRAELLRQYRSILLNIDQQIIKELAVDFMGIF